MQILNGKSLQTQPADLWERACGAKLEGEEQAGRLFSLGAGHVYAANHSKPNRSKTQQIRGCCFVSRWGLRGVAGPTLHKLENYDSHIGISDLSLGLKGISSEHTSGVGEKPESGLP